MAFLVSLFQVRRSGLRYRKQRKRTLQRLLRSFFFFVAQLSGFSGRDSTLFIRRALTVGSM